MADERIYYVLGADNCRFEGMTKEQILAAITQAVETGTIQNVDTGFVTRIKEQNSGSAVTLWVGTQAQYNALATKEPNCLYILTDDNTVQEMQDAILALQNGYDGITNTNVVVDVSSSTSLTFSASHVSVSDLSKKYVYSKALGIVFYSVSFNATFTQAKSALSFSHVGGIIPAVNTPSVAPAVAYASGTNTTAFYSTSTVQGTKKAALNVNFGAELEGQHHFDISGWYFAQEEAT